MEISQDDMIELMGKSGIIPVFNHKDIDVAKVIINTAYRAGVRVFEFTNREKNALEVFRKLRIHADTYPGILLGIGTIFSREDAENFVTAEADFIVSPALIPEVAEFCKMKQKLWIPGCATLTEVYQARSMGAQLIKAFPGNMLGPNFIKAVRSVMPDVKLMPTGGVMPSKENLHGWFSAGVHCVGMGSQLFDQGQIDRGEFEDLKSNIEKVLAIVSDFKNSSS